MRPDQYSFHKNNTPEHICNMAAGYLGRYSDSISNLGLEASLQECARACLLYYDTTRRAFLEEWTWSFAIKEMLLQEYIPKPNETPRLDGTYIKPSDIIKIISIGEKSCGCLCDCACDMIIGYNFKILEGKILPCKGNWIRYVYNNETLETWSAMAIKAFSLGLASAAAGSITMDSTYFNASAIGGAYAEALGEAKKLDSYATTQHIRYARDDRGRKNVLSNPYYESCKNFFW